MATESVATRVPWGHVLRAAGMVLVVVPLLVQALLLAGIYAAAGLGPTSPFMDLPDYANYALLGVLLAVPCAWLGQTFARRCRLPLSVWWRYAPLLAYPLLIWVIWVSSMFVSKGDFTQESLGMFVVLLPFVVLVLASAFGISLWMLLLVPLLVYAAFMLGFVRGSRQQPMQPGTPRKAAALLTVAVLGLTGITVAQAVQRQQTVVTSKEDVLREEVPMHRYRPFAKGNLLRQVTPKPSLRFDLSDAPRLDGATAAYPVYAAAAQALYTEQAADEKVRVSKTPEAYERLIAGETDLIFVAQASPAQKKAAADKGVELVFTPVAKEAFVFLVRADNPVQGLALEQIRAIYSGQISNWREVGGADARIMAYQRPPNSGSQTVMEAKVMQGKPMMQPLAEERVQGMGGLVRQVAAYRNAAPSLGYSFRYYVTQMVADADAQKEASKRSQPVRLLAMDGVEPTPENIRSGRYPLTVDVYMVTRKNPPTPVRQLQDWFSSDSGQRLVQEVGYVSVR